MVRRSRLGVSVALLCTAASAVAAAPPRAPRARENTGPTTFAALEAGDEARFAATEIATAAAFGPSHAAVELRETADATLVTRLTPQVAPGVPPHGGRVVVLLAGERRLIRLGTVFNEEDLAGNDVLVEVLRGEGRLAVRLVGDDDVDRLEPSDATATALATSPPRPRRKLGGRALTSTDLIDRAEAAQEIDRETAVIYRVYAIVGDARLPLAYRASDAAVFESLYLMEVAAEWDTYSPATQAALQDRAALIADAILAAETSQPDTAGAVATALSQGFATQAAFATLQVENVAQFNATQTAVAEATGDVDALATEVAAGNAATLTARITDLENALATIESVLATQVAQGGALATQAAQATPAAIATQAALATSVAGQPFMTREVVIVLPGDNDAALATLAAVQTQVAEIGDISGLEAFATQAAFMTPPALSTAAAVGTQAALAARAELIRQALILELAQCQPTQESIDANAVALTATSLALTLAPGPTQEALATSTQSFVALPTALPDTGLFDDVAGGGRDGIGMLALAAVGLLGVIVVSRRLRSSGNNKK